MKFLKCRIIVYKFFKNKNFKIVCVVNILVLLVVI